MFVLFWVTLLFSVRGSSADTDSSTGLKQHCDSYLTNYCVSLSEGTITAEAGLCVVIPCSFTTASGFTPSSIVWYKCDPSEDRCGDSDIIFHSKKTNINAQSKVQSGFKGRVSSLEPDVSQRNCSIMINDLNESDSGLYQLRVNGYVNGWTSGFTYPPRSTVSVKGLSQKPTVMIPPLTEGQQTTLTCTAPGLCSGSVPTITWMWRGAAEDDSLLRGNITAYQTENVTAVTQRHSSTLTFNSSAEHHGTSITCKVSFTGGATTEETLTLTVNYVKEIQITGDRSVKEGETLNVTCSVDSFPPSFITWTKYSEPSIQTVTGTNLQNNETDTLFISNVTREDSGQYICTAKHLNNTLMEKVNVNVIYKRKPQITGDRTVEEGETLNLTCSVDSFPLSLITWTKLSSNLNLENGTDNDLHNNTGSASLVISNVTTEDSGQYICTAKHLDTTVTLYVNVTVTWFPKIQNESVCVSQSEVLTCVCISEGFPIPTIEWPLLENHTEYSVITTVSNHTVNSTVTLTVKHHGYTVVECVSHNRNGKVKKNLISIKTEQEALVTHHGCYSGVLPWAVAGVSISVNVLCIICILGLWNARKKVNPNQEDRTYMSLQKTDTPSEYEVIALRPN